MAGQTLNDLYLLLVPEIRKMFLKVMGDISDDVIIAQLAAAIESSDPVAAFEAIGFTQAALAPLLDAIELAYKNAANVTVDSQFPARIKTPTGSFVFNFDARNLVAEAQIKDNSSALITRLTDEARLNVQAALERGLIAGDNPRTTALNIVGRIDPVTKSRVGGLIGLTTQQENWVANGQRYLEQLDSRYLTLTLRDKRFDSIVKKAIDSGKALSEDTVSKLMTAYKNRTLKYRADVISRTETIQAINRGEYESYRQAIEDGLIDQSLVGKEWDDVGDNRVRHSHRVLAKKYGKDNPIGFDDPFIAPSGAQMMYPGDVSLGAGGDEIIGCRCKQKIRVDWIANALGDE